MSRLGTIQTGIGLISGMDITGTVDQLVSLSAIPRDNAELRSESLKSEQVAITELSAFLVSVQFVAKNLGKDYIFETTEVASSNANSLSVVSRGSPNPGTYQFTPLQTVTNHQYFSSRFESNDQPLGAGNITLRFGGDVKTGAELDQLGGGLGFERGKIRITDRSGASAVIDLSTASSFEDVFDAINTNETVNVKAVASGDSIQLQDNTGQTVTNLRVEEVAGGGTAASLGLAGIDVAADTATGNDRLWLYDTLELSSLNDGNGVAFDWVLDDIDYTLRDGTSGSIDLGEGDNKPETLGELIDEFNTAAAGKLEIEIGPDGDRLIVTDLTTGVGQTQLSASGDSKALEDLGLANLTAVDGLITGRRLIGGIQTVLMSTLGGGSGVGELGEISITDRAGNSATVDLSGAETLNEVLDAINVADIGIRAGVNASKTGIELTDTSGGLGNLIVADADATSTATNLGLLLNDSVMTVDSGDMHRQVFGEGTRLASINGGAGVATGSFTIIDATGREVRVAVTDSADTIGEAIREINRSSTTVMAEINETGDGIVLRDLTGSGGTIRVEEGSSTTAADLNLLGEATEVEIDGKTYSRIDGSMTRVIELDEDDTLTDLQTKINDLGMGVTAGIFSDGSSRPYRISLTSERSGTLGRMVIDTSGAGFSLFETVRAQDARLLYGGGDSAATGVIVSSSSNSFTNLIENVTLNVLAPSSSPVTVTVKSSDTDLVTNMETFVANYNKFRDRLNDLTQYDLVTETKEILAGDATARRFEEDMARAITQRYFTGSSITTLRQIGVTLKDDGTLSFDSAAFKREYKADPQAVRAFFTTEGTGFSEVMDDLTEGLAGAEHSLWSSRNEALDRVIAESEARIEFLTQRLQVQRERLLLDFYNMEIAISNIQSNLTAIKNIGYIAMPDKN